MDERVDGPREHEPVDEHEDAAEQRDPEKPGDDRDHAADAAGDSGLYRARRPERTRRFRVSNTTRSNLAASPKIASRSVRSPSGDRRTPTTRAGGSDAADSTMGVALRFGAMSDNASMRGASFRSSR